jgi:putative zinc finger protein
MNNCLDTGTIQAFLDGELTPAAASNVSAHIAICDACAAQLATAEDESAFVFSVLEREMETLVPTQRLWNKINESIEVEKHNLPFWKKAWGALVASLANPAIAVAAAALIVFGISSVVIVKWSETGPQTGGYVAHVTEPVKSGQISTTNPGLVSSSSESNPNVVSAPAGNSKPNSAKAENASYKQPTGPKGSKPPVVQADYIAGEENYVKTIDTLAKNVDNQKDTVLRPSERVSYERDMWVVNDAISKMRKEVQKNPKNESAKQVLYSSYQNKIDLLNSVSQREELVASLK